MSFNEDILSSLKVFILEQHSIQTDKLISHVDSKINELQKIIKVQSEKSEKLERKLNEVKARNEFLEKEIRKNDIIIFNLNCEEENLLSFTINKLNEALKLPMFLTEYDINNIYTIGRSSNKPIVVSFVRFVTKQSILKYCKNLKGSDIRISEVLTVEERRENKVLRHYLKEAKEKNLKAHIYRNKLYIESKPYSVNELEAGNKELISSNQTETENAIEDNLQTNGSTEPEIQEINTQEKNNGAIKKTVVRSTTRRQKQITKSIS